MGSDSGRATTRERSHWEGSALFQRQVTAGDKALRSLTLAANPISHISFWVAFAFSPTGRSEQTTAVQPQARRGGGWGKALLGGLFWAQQNPVWMLTGGQWGERTPSLPSSCPKGSPTDVLDKSARHFSRCLRGERVCPLSQPFPTPHQACRSQRWRASSRGPHLVICP